MGGCAGRRGGWWERVGLFLLSLRLWDMREGCSPFDTGCQLVSRRPSLAEEQWGSLLSPLPWPVSPSVERDKREGIWLSWHSGGRSRPAKADNSGTLCSENVRGLGLATGAAGGAPWERVCPRGSGMWGFPLLQRRAVPCRTLRFGWQPVHPPASGQSWSHSGGGGEGA